MLKKLLIASLLISTASTFAGTTDIPPANAVASAPQPILFTSNKKPLVVEQGKPFTITLLSNPTTGFSWSWKSTQFDKNVVTLVDHKYVAPINTKLVGAPGYETWTFVAKKGNYRVNQVCHIVMQYARPWEKDKKDATVTKFIIVVKKS